MTRRVAAPLGIAVLILLVGTPVLGGATTDVSSPRRPRRVLVFSIPHVSWSDIDKLDLPNLNRLLDRSAVAGLTTRVDHNETRLADGYLTFGAGTRALGDPLTDGDNLDVDEPYGDGTAGEAFEQRTGIPVQEGIVSLADPAVVETNDELLYNAEIGALGAALRDAGFRRAVIGNGDGRRAETAPSQVVSRHRRQVALALTDPQGRLPAGTVSRDLLRGDPDAPFGRRLDEDAVVDAFTRVWRDRSVVLVEASDLVREDVYLTVSTELHHEAELRTALRRSDRLLGRLLEEVDLDRDAVIVFGPTHSQEQITLTVLGVHTPGGRIGLLQSATTRRPGFVQLIDMAPTLLDVIGVARPDSMEGRPAELVDEGTSARERRDRLVRASEAAVFRDGRVGETQAAFVFFGALIVIGTVFVIRKPRAAWARAAVGRGALCLLGLVPATFLTRLFPLDEAGVGMFWIFVVSVAAVLGWLYHRCGRNDPLDAVLAAMLVNIVLLTADVLTGSHVQFNSPLGYSPTSAGRFVGFANVAYAAVAASTVIAAPLLARRVGGQRGVWWALALLFVVIVIDGAPFWGSDVGGILSMVPAFAITGVLLLGWRVRGRTVLWCLVGLVVALVVFTGLDLLRPSEDRTHLGRLVERVEERGVGDLVVTLRRKLSANLATLTETIWGLMLPLVAVFAIWLARRVPDRVRAAWSAYPALHVSAVGFGIVSVLGYLLNDSGIAIPGMMLAIALATAVWLLVQVPPARSTRTATPSAPVREPVAVG